ncbi:hypothetical protein AMC82_PC00072 (plasmid) [Rhizobium phaseoli]|uniref:Uncharacterized protein n=2 Tax=Rhizobium TaxID=379 RepID=A0A7W6MI84_9HYPH|nr:MULTISPECIES: hypothetical protein [Rhizobium]ANL81445.1 hypothetical protein AMC82_PC00072 [Rhizobium phaseoli]ANL87933.1 hypothetical protein AMC81_PD00076 [Rhizobium phaseoli]ANL94442.1 hypothetical protein AMC80_PD00076 [Rhizobium phaseoli]ANM06828.1 hypothetical protein AMC78_PB00024 [Rhizobium phaseoli]MBB4193199.1 hypothetical protein [Rhizobium aethiopicum]
MPRLQLLQRVDPVRSFDHEVGKRLQAADRHSANSRVVLDHRDSFRAPRRGFLSPLLVRMRILSGVGAWKKEAHRRPFAKFAVELQVPCGLLCETVDHAQPKPRSRARRFRGEERSKALSITSDVIPVPVSVTEMRT